MIQKNFFFNLQIQRKQIQNCGPRHTLIAYPIEIDLELNKDN